MFYLFVLFCLCTITTPSFLNGEEIDNAPLIITDQNPLFVSLGSDCLTASMIRHFGQRKVAFPFDWMRTPDEVGLVELLRNNFQDFTNPAYLVKHPLNNTTLVHRHYHMEFSHDWLEDYWQNDILCQEEIKKLQIKLERRVARFQQLVHYKGPVVFIRVLQPAYPREDLYWFDYHPYNNEKECSLKLYDVLRNLFPTLDFKLIVVNKTEDKNWMEIFNNITLYYFSNLQEHRNWEQLCK